MAIRYVVEPVDVDGDGIPDGDLVKKYDGKKLISQKFVPAKKMEKIADRVIDDMRSSGANVTMGKRQRLVYKRPEAAQNQEEKPVLVADKTAFGQYIKQGAGNQFGTSAMDLVFDGLAALF